MCTSENEDGIYSVEKTHYTLLTVHGEFLSGGGKRGLLSNAEPRWPLDWPPSTPNVAPLNTHIKHADVEKPSEMKLLTHSKNGIKSLSIHTEILKCDCSQSELSAYF